MIGLQLTVSLAAVVYGMIACARRKQPLFFKILLYGLVSYLVGTLFVACYSLVYKMPPTGFHVGYFGHVGAYFFLLSSYYGAMDRLADGGEDKYRVYRRGAIIAPLIPLGMLLYSIVKIGFGLNLPFILLTVPMGLTLYFALKHLILPDVELGIIRVMRSYNICVILFCIFEILSQFPLFSQVLRDVALAVSCIFLLALLPLAEKGVRKWFI